MVRFNSAYKEQQLILKPKKLKNLGLLLFFFVMIIIGCFALREGRLLGIIPVAFGVFGFFILTVALFTNRCALRLDHTGIRFGTVRKIYCYFWSDIVSFGVSNFGVGRRVCFNFRLDYHGEERLQAVNRGTIGFDRFLPDTYGKEPMELATLLEEWRQRYSKTNRAAN